MKFLVALTFLGVSSAGPIPQLLAYNNLPGITPVAYAHHSIAGVPTVYNHHSAPHHVAAPHPYRAIPVPALRVAQVPVAQHVGYKVTNHVQHIPRVSVERHTSAHTTHHVINHPAISSLQAHPAVAPPAVAAQSSAPVVSDGGVIS